MLPLIFLSLLLMFGGRFAHNIIEKKNIATHGQIEVEKTVEPSSSPEIKVESKVEGAKIEVKLDTKSTQTSTPIPNSNIDNFKYPNSKTVSSSSNNLTLESTDSNSKITDWYKAKISDGHMNVKTFVTTTTNGKVENKLVAANGAEKVEVEITGNDGSALSIFVTLSSI